MRKYWLLDQHGADGPTALVESDGRMRVVRILQFGPGITDLEAQVAIRDQVMGKIAPSLKPLVDAGAIEVQGVEPHIDLDAGGGSSRANRGARRKSGSSGRSGGGRTGSGPSRKGGRGDR